MYEFKIASKTFPSRLRDASLVWLASISAVAISLGILVFIRYGPFSVIHRIGPLLVWLLISVILGALGVDFVMLRRTFERMKLDLTFLLTEEDLIRRRPGYSDVSIALSQIKSLHEQSGCLVVTGGEPARRIAVPKNVENFELLQAKLLKHGALIAAPRRSLLGWAAFPISIVVWSLLLWSTNLAVVRVAGVLALLLLVRSSHYFYSSLRRGTKRFPLWLFLGASWAATVFVIYIRIFKGLGG